MTLDRYFELISDYKAEHPETRRHPDRRLRGPGVHGP